MVEHTPTEAEVFKREILALIAHLGEATGSIEKAERTSKVLMKIKQGCEGHDKPEVFQEVSKVIQEVLKPFGMVLNWVDE